MSGFPIYYLEITRSFTIAAAFIITYAYYNYNSSKFSVLQKYSLIGLFILSVVFFGIMFLSSIQPKDWDFTCFYLIGKVAHSGLDIYNPDHYFLVLRDANIPFNLSADFKSEFMVTACLYPPPTIFLFYPLGFMTYMQGMYFFYALILIATIGCIYQLKISFFNNAGWQSWLIISIILMFTAPFYSVIYYSQTLIFLLFFFILIYKNKDRKIAGLYLAISIFIKPFAIVFFLYFLIRKRWDVILSFILSTFGIVLITIICFGAQPFYEYLLNNPSHRIPNYILFEDVNQSLLAILSRAMDNFQKAKIIYYIISIGLFIFSGFVLLFQIKKNKVNGLLFPFLLSVCLIIYPNALYHYAVVHILSLMVLVSYLKNPRLIYLYLFLFFLVLYGRIFYLNIYILIVSLLLIFEDQVRGIIYKHGVLIRLIK